MGEVPEVARINVLSDTGLKGCLLIPGSPDPWQGRLKNLFHPLPRNVCDQSVALGDMGPCAMTGATERELPPPHSMHGSYAPLIQPPVSCAWQNAVPLHRQAWSSMPGSPIYPFNQHSLCLERSLLPFTSPTPPNSYLSWTSQCFSENFPWPLG